MTKAFVLAKLNLTTDTELANVFGISRSAVGQWEEDKPIPEGRQYELKARRPDLFKNVPILRPLTEDDLPASAREFLCRRCDELRASLGLPVPVKIEKSDNCEGGRHHKCKPFACGCDCHTAPASDVVAA